MNSPKVTRMGGKSHSPIQRGAATPRHHTLEYNDDGDVNVSAPLMSSSNMEAQQKDFLPMFSSSSSSSSSSKKQYYDGVGGESKYGKKTSTADLLNGLSHGAGGGASVLRLNKRSIQLIAGIFMLLFFIPNAYVYLFDKKAATAAAAGGGGDGVEYDTTSKKSRQSTIVAISIPTSTPPTPPLYSFNSKSELLAQCESLQSSIKPHEGDIKPASPKSIPSTFPSTTLPSVVESQYQLLVKPRFPDISEEVFNALPAKCKKYLVGQIPLDDQSISPQGIDGQEFTKVIEWRKNNSDHEKLTWADPIPRPQNLTTKMPSHIFFIHFNDKLEIPAYLCAIESAARHHPNHSISVFVKSADVMTNSSVYQKWMEANPSTFKSQIRLRTLDYKRAFYGTPMQAWYEDGKYIDSSWVDQNLGNALRLAVLWAEGGIYMDLDVVSINSYAAVEADGGRMIGREDGEKANNAVLVFPERDPFIYSAMKTFVERWNGKLWGNNGPQCITRTLIKECRQDLKSHDFIPNSKFEMNTERFAQNAEVCTGLVMAGTNRVYPFLWFERQKYIGKWTDNECDAVDKMSRESIALHWWNKMIKFDKDQPEQDRVHVNSVIFKVMQKHCPSYIYTQGAESMGVDVKQ